MKNIRVIGIGDNVCDQYAHTKIMYPGGQAMNFSVYAKMLGADSAYMGVFGDDKVAEHVVDTLRKFRIDISHCRHYHGENGYARVTIINGDRRFLFSNKGGVLKEHPLCFDQNDLDYISTFELVHTSNNSYINPQLPVLSKLPLKISYDFSGRMWKDPKFINETAPFIDFAFLSVDSDSREKANEVVNEMHVLGVTMSIITMGSEGAVVSYHDQKFRFKPERVNAVDTLGAGDSFATGFLLSILKNGKSNEAIMQAMQDGQDLATKTCMVEGAYGHGVPFKL